MILSQLVGLRKPPRRQEAPGSAIRFFVGATLSASKTQIPGARGGFPAPVAVSPRPLEGSPVLHGVQQNDPPRSPCNSVAPLQATDGGFAVPAGRRRGCVTAPFRS